LMLDFEVTRMLLEHTTDINARDDTVALRNGQKR
jgi:hypothetical protein